MLEKLDRLCLAGTFSGDRLIKFFFCRQFHIDRTPDLDQEDKLTLEDFLTDDNNDNCSDTLDDFANF